MYSTPFRLLDKMTMSITELTGHILLTEDEIKQDIELISEHDSRFSIFENIISYKRG